MSAGHLDAVRNKYNFKELRIASWRDPKLSVHPARGGPKSPTISSEAFSRPYVPTYKVRYKPPEPTDDEESGSDHEPSPPPTLDSPLEAPSAASEEPVVEQADPAEVPESSEAVDDSQEPIAKLSPPDSTEPVVEVIEEQQPSGEEENLHKGDLTDPPEDVSEPGPAEGSEQSQHETTEAQPDLETDDPDEVIHSAQKQQQDPAELLDTPPAGQQPDSVPAPVEDSGEIPSPPQPTHPEETQVEVPPEAPEPPTHFEDSIEPLTIDTSVNDDPSIERGEKSPKSVQFAPGTPEPKPTHRKKKSAKTTKTKKKKTFPASEEEEAPSDIVVTVEDSSEASPPDIPSISKGSLEEKSQESPPPSLPQDPNLETITGLEQRDGNIAAPANSSLSEETLSQAQAEPADMSASPADHVEPIAIPDNTPIKIEKPKKKKTGSSRKSSKETALHELELAPSSSPPPPPPPIEEISAAAMADDLPTKERSNDKKKKKSSKSKSRGSSTPSTSVLPTGPGIDSNEIADDPPPPLPPAEDIQEGEIPHLESTEQGEKEQVDATANETMQSPPTAQDGQAPAVDQDQSAADQQTAASDKSDPEPSTELHEEQVQGDEADSAHINNDGLVKTDVESVSEIHSETADKDAVQSTDEVVAVTEDALVESRSEEQTADVMEEVDDAREDLPPDEAKEDLPLDEAKEELPPDSAIDIQEATNEHIADEVIDVDANSEAEHEPIELTTSDASVIEDTDGDLENVPNDTASDAHVEIAEETKANEDDHSGDELEDSEEAQAIPHHDGSDEHIGVIHEDTTEAGSHIEVIHEDTTEAGSVIETSEILKEGVHHKEANADDQGESGHGEDSVGQVDESAGTSHEQPPEKEMPLPEENTSSGSTELAEVEESSVDEPPAAVDPEGHVSPEASGENKQLQDESPPEDVAKDAESAAEDVHLPDMPSENTPPAVETQVESSDAALGSDEAVESKEAAREEVAVEEIEKDAIVVEQVASTEAAEPTAESPLELTTESKSIVEESVPKEVELENEGSAAPEAPAEISTADAEKTEEPAAATPPSPVLSKSSGSKHKAAHWERHHLQSKFAPSESKEAAETSRSSKRSSRVVNDVVRSSERSRRPAKVSMTPEEMASRERRREERKAAQAARIIEEERRLADEAELRRIRHEARRAARKAAAEESVRLAKEEAESMARKEAERRRRHHEERERARSSREAKPLPAAPKLFGFATGQSSTQAGLFVRKSSDGKPRMSPPSSSRRSGDAHSRPSSSYKASATEEVHAKEGSRDGEGSSSHHRRHRPRHHHQSRSDGEREHEHRELPQNEGDPRDRHRARRSKQPATAEPAKSKGLLGSLLRGF